MDPTPSRPNLSDVPSPPKPSTGALEAPARPGLLRRVPALWAVPTILAVGDVVGVQVNGTHGAWIVAVAVFLAVSALVGIPAAWHGERLRRSGIADIDRMDGLVFEHRLGVLFSGLLLTA